MSEPHKLVNAEFDWNRLQVKKFCLRMVYEFDWSYCSQQYIENFVACGWSFEEFKSIAEYNGYWVDSMSKLEKLHNLSSFQ